MRIWGIHMGAHVASAPIEKNYVAIGWPNFGDLTAVKPNRDAFKNQLAQTYPQINSGAIPVKAGVLFRFANEIKEGDLVIYPSKNDRMVNVGCFDGSYQYIEGDSSGYPNQRGVKWLGSYPRDEFPQAALNEIGSAVTLFTVRRYAQDFLDKVGFTADAKNITNLVDTIEESEDDQTATDEVSRQAEVTTHDFIIRALKNQLSPYDFEHFVAHIMECMGYTARVTQASADGGVDVIAHKDELGFEPPIIKVQCKQITGKSSEPEANQLLGTLGDGEFALFVNLGSYSRSARVLERNRAKLRLIDGEQLVEIILDNYHKLSPRYRTLMPLRQIYVPDFV